MELRCGLIQRVTRETDIELGLKLDGSGVARIDTAVPFLNHMLTLFAVHGFFDLEIKATGDVEVDAHHTVEDVGICLGQAFGAALGDKKGIGRYGLSYLPMDETLGGSWLISRIGHSCIMGLSCLIKRSGTLILPWPWSLCGRFRSMRE